MVQHIDQNWLPEGHHWGLNVIHAHAPHDAGSHIRDPAIMLWHTTEGSGMAAMHRVLVAKKAEPHFLIDPRPGDATVIQLLPLNVAARALEHPGGTPETNRAGVIQVEVADFAANAPRWEEYFYRDLAALAVLVEHRCPRIARRAPTFGLSGHAHRFTGSEFLKWSGHCGHEHAPNQPSGHWDPGAMSPNRLFRAMTEVEKAHA